MPHFSRFPRGGSGRGRREGNKKTCEEACGREKKRNYAFRQLSSPRGSVGVCVCVERAEEKKEEEEEEEEEEEKEEECGACLDDSKSHLLFLTWREAIWVVRP